MTFGIKKTHFHVEMRIRSKECDRRRVVYSNANGIALSTDFVRFGINFNQC